VKLVKESLYESLIDYLEPKKGDEIVNSLSILSKAELDDKLLDTVINGLTTIVKYIIKAGADVNTKDKYGRTALHLASYYMHKQIVKILLDAGADVNAKDQYGYTPLHVATFNGYEQIVKILIEAGADVNVNSIGRGTPLQCAVDRGNLYIIRLLKSYDVKKNES